MLNWDVMGIPADIPVFTPWFWAPGAHLQTVLGAYLPAPMLELPWETWDLPLPDGDVLKQHHLAGDSGVVVHLFHGLGGSARARYVIRLAHRFRQMGHAVLALDHRGAGAGVGLAARPYHSGATADLSAALAAGRRRYPHARHIAIGFSISGNILLLLMGRPRPGEERPDAAIAVNPPVDLDACSRRLMRGLCRIYDARFVLRLKKEVEARVQGGRLAPVDMSRVRTLRDFDAAYTAPQAGFRDRADYYAQCSCGPHLQAIDRRTWILSSDDDPIAPAEDLLRHPLSAATGLLRVARGGHMGYLAKPSPRLPDGRWMDLAVEQLLEDLGTVG